MDSQRAEAQAQGHLPDVTQLAHIWAPPGHVRGRWGAGDGARAAVTPPRRLSGVSVQLPSAHPRPASVGLPLAPSSAEPIPSEDDSEQVKVV